MNVRKFLSNNLILLIMMNGAAVFNYVFQFIACRGLTPENYGVFNSLNSSLTLYLALFLSFPMAVSRFTVEVQMKHPDALGTFTGKVMKFFLTVLMVQTVAGLLLMPVLKSYFHYSETLPYVMMIIVMAGAIMVYPVSAFFQGSGRFAYVGLLNILFPVLKVAFGLVLVLYLGMQVKGALGAYAAGAAAICAYSIYLYFKFYASAPKGALPDGIFRRLAAFMIPATISSFTLSMFSSIDMIMIRHYFPTDEAGYYAVAAVIGKIALFLPGAVLFVILPEAAKNNMAGDKSFKLLYASLAIVFAISASFVVVVWAVPEFVIRVLFGSGYGAAAPLLKYIGSAMAFVIMTGTISTFNLGRSSYLYLAPLIFGVILEPVLISMFHESIFQVVQMVLTAAATTFVLTLGATLIRR